MSNPLLLLQIISQQMGSYQYQSLSLKVSNSFPHCLDSAADWNMRITILQSTNQYGSK